MIHSYVSGFKICYHSVSFLYPGWPQTHCAAQAALNLMVTLWLQLTKYWGHRH